jgi:hypothetical protein
VSKKLYKGIAIVCLTAEDHLRELGVKASNNTTFQGLQKWCQWEPWSLSVRSETDPLEVLEVLAIPLKKKVTFIMKNLSRQTRETHNKPHIALTQPPWSSQGCFIDSLCPAPLPVLNGLESNSDITTLCQQDGSCVFKRYRL